KAAQFLISPAGDGHSTLELASQVGYDPGGAPHPREARGGMPVRGTGRRLLRRENPVGLVAPALLPWAGMRWTRGPGAPAADTAGFHGATLTPEPAPPIALIDHRGREFDLHAQVQQGNVVLLFFGYTSCPDVCPMTLSHHKQVKQILGEHAARVQ